jgi:uncharacterized protein (DUF1684 family)
MQTNHLVNLALALALTASAAPAFCAPADIAYSKNIEAWRATQEKDLTTDSGWLTVIGLFWLKDGVNSVGTETTSTVRFPLGSTDAKVGTFVRNSGQVFFAPTPGVAVTVNGKALEGKTLIHSETDMMKTGRITFFIIKRNDRLGIRVKDPESAARKHFAGRKWFDVNESYRIQAEFHPYPSPRDLSIKNAIGQDILSKALGTVTFERDGKKFELIVEGEDLKKDLSINFKDKTNGKETYGAGRFLEVASPQGNRIVIDFNKAYNPPCAFTAYATCPLAPKENRLDTRIEAGEKSAAH